MTTRLSDQISNNDDNSNTFEDMMTFSKRIKSSEISKNEFSGDYYNNNIYDTRHTVDSNHDYNMIPYQYTDNEGYQNDPSYYYNSNVNDNFINDMAFLHPKDTSGYTSIYPVYPNNDWSRLSYSPTYSNTSNSTLSPKSQDSSPISPNYESSVFITVDLHEILFNRLQWYHITCKFENNSGMPMFSGYNVVLDHSVQFVDGRRRTSLKPYNCIDEENTIYISAVGTCASTGRMLKKCKRCREKDKSLRKRKRKREENEIWSELDEENNNKLIQLFSSGENVIDENGELKFRIRVGCCVGVSKQHHINHVNFENGKETLEIHRSCEGLLLSLKAVLPSDSTITCYYSKPIRILGKVTEADKQKFSPDYKFLEKGETFKPLSSKPSMESDIEDVGNIFHSKRSFIGCSSCAAKGDRELFSKVDPSKVKPSVLLQHFATTFKNVFENVFTKRQISNICNDSFFANPPLETFSSDTPSMLQVYTILAVGACMSGYLDTADRFWDRATKLADHLSQQPISEKNEVLLLADGLNRVSFYYGSGSDPEKGFYFSNKSYERLIHLSKTHPEVLNMDVYETALWSRITYKMEKNILEEVKQWATERKNLEILSYVIFLQVITRIIPDLREFVYIKTKDKSIVAHNDKKYSLDEFLLYFNELKDVFEKTGYKNYTCGNHKYSKLIEEGFGCIESWMRGDKVKGLEQARSAAIQCSLLEHPQFPSLIPTYFACIVCAKVAETKHPSSIPYIDYAELCIKSFSRVTHFRWVRIIADYFIKKIDVITGRCIEMNTCPLRDRNFDNFST